MPTSGKFSDRPRILHVLGTSEIGGTERFVVELLGRMQSEFESRIAVLNAPGRLVAEYERVAQAVRHFGRPGWLGMVSRWRALLREWQPDVIVMYGSRANLLGRTVTPRLPRSPALVSALRSVVVDDRGGRLAPTLDRLTFSRLAACVSNSQAALEECIDRGYPAERLCYIPPGIDIARFASPERDDARRSLGIPSAELTLLSVANLRRVKNIETLLLTSSELRQAGVTHRLWLVGDGPERTRLERLAATLEIDGHVVFAGYQADPRPYYAAADLFVLASRWEGSPTSLLEAAAYGVPAIAAAVGDVPQIVRDRVDGRLLRPGTPRQFSRAIQEYLGDSALVSGWRSASKARSASQSITEITRRYVSLFQWAAGPRTLAPPSQYCRRLVPVRIARVLSRLNVGGPAIHVALLSSQLNDAQYSTDLISGTLAPGEGDMAYLCDELGVSVRYVRALRRSINPLSEVIALAQLLRLFREIRPDVVHTHASKAGTLGRIAAVLYNVTRSSPRRAVIVHTYHGHTFTGYFSKVPAWVFRNIERMLGRVTDRVIVLSRTQQEDIVSRFRIAPKDRTLIVPLGLALDRFFDIGDAERRAARNEIGLAQNMTLFLCPGRFSPVKNHTLLLNAFAQTVESDKRAKLVLAGDGELSEDLKLLATQLGVSHLVSFTGWLRDMRPLYAAADVVVLASRNEGTPVALIEALAAGCTIVATRVGGIPDIVDEGCGLLVPANDTDALARAMMKATTTARPVTRCRDAARRFSIDRLVKDLTSLYTELLDERRRVMDSKVP